jgi:DNA recombination protein RmuC
MDTILIYLLLVLVVIAIVLIIVFRNKKDIESSNELEKKINDLQSALITIERALKDDFRINREESAGVANTNRQELQKAIQEFRNEMTQVLQLLSKQNVETLEKNIQTFNESMRQKFTDLESRQSKLVEATEKKLESIRTTPRCKQCLQHRWQSKRS